MRTGPGRESEVVETDPTPFSGGSLPGDGDKEEGLTPQSALVWLIIIGTAVRLLLAGVTGLGVDESYMVSVARQPSLSYFDHPPLSFWLVKLMTWLFGSEASWVVRLPFILLFAGSTWLCYQIGSQLFDRRTGWFGALALNLAPVFTLCDGNWVLPDGPLVFFMLAAVFCLLKIFFSREDRPVFGWWLAAGATTGMALLSKYIAVFLVFGAALYLLTRRDRWRRISGAGPWAALLLAAALFSPVILWNRDHHWISFVFQSGRGTPGASFHPLMLLQTIGGQALYLAPWIWVPLVAVLGRSLFSRPRQDRKLFLAMVASGPIVAFTLVALWAPGRVLPHWSMPGYLLVFPLLGAQVADHLRSGRRYVRPWLIGSVVALALLAVGLASHVATGWARSMVPALTRNDPTIEMVDWHQLPEALARQGLIQRSRLFVVTGRWLDAGKADFAIGGRLPVVCLSQDPRHYAFLHDLPSFAGWDAVIVTANSTENEIQQNLGVYFDRLEPLDDVVIRQPMAEALTLKLFYASGFRARYRLPYS